MRVSSEGKTGQTGVVRNASEIRRRQVDWIASKHLPRVTDMVLKRKQL